jgi:hypothetical protein
MSRVELRAWSQRTATESVESKGAEELCGCSHVMYGQTLTVRMCSTQCGVE